MKKTLVLLLALVMLIGMMPLNALASEVTQTECNHSYEAVVTAPTCTEQGYTAYTCECGESYVADYVEATGHSYENGVCTACDTVLMETLSTKIELTKGHFVDATGEPENSAYYFCVIGYELKKGHTLSVYGGDYVFSVRQLIDGNYNTLLKSTSADSFTATKDMTVAIRVRVPSKTALSDTDFETVALYDTLFAMKDVPGSVHRFTVEAETIDGGTATTRAAIFLPESYSEEGDPTRLVVMTNGARGHLSESIWNNGTADDISLMKNYMEAGYAVLVVDNTTGRVGGAQDWGNPQHVDSYFKAYGHVQKYFNVEEQFCLHSRSMGTMAALRIMREHPELVKCAIMCGAVSSLHAYFANDPAFIAKRFGFNDTTGAIYEADKVVGYDTYTDIVNAAEYALPPTFWMLSEADAVSRTLSMIDDIEAFGNEVETKIYTGTDHSGVCRLNIDECWNDALAYLEAHQESTAEHRFRAWETIKTATCTESGELRRSCADCDHYETMAVETVGIHSRAEGTDFCSFCGKVWLIPLYTQIPVLENKLQIDASVLEDTVYGHVRDYLLLKGRTLSISSPDHVFSVRQFLDGDYSTTLKVPADADNYTATSDMTVGVWVRRPDSSELADGELDGICMIDNIYGMIGVEGYVHRFTVEAETIDGGTATTRAAIFLPESYSEDGDPTKLVIMTNGGSAYLTDSSWQGNTEANRNLVEMYLQNGYAVLVNDNTAGKIVNSSSEMVPDLGCLQQLSGLMKSWEYVSKVLNLERQFSIHARSQGTFVGIRIMREYPELVKCAIITGPNVSAAHRWTVITNKAHTAERFGFADLTGSTFEADKFVGNDIYTDMAADDYSLPPTFWMESSNDVCPNNNQSIYEVVERLRELGCTAEYQKFSDLTHSETCRLASEEAASAAMAFLEAYQTQTHTHNYTPTVIAPTCTEQGYTTYTCACGESYVDEYVEATGHSYENGVCAVCKIYKKINTDRNINYVGMSIWWYDGRTLASGTGGGVTAKGYQTLLAERFDFLSETNYCYSGYSLGGISASDSRSIAGRVANWRGNTGDIWTLDTITNDFKRNIPIGTIDDYINNTGITTFYGALRVFADRVSELSGDNSVVLCANALRRNNSGYTSTSKNTQGHTLEDYDIAMRAIAKRNGWYFVDQFNDSGITDELVASVTIDGLHLNNAGYEMAVRPWIKVLENALDNAMHTHTYENGICACGEMSLKITAQPKSDEALLGERYCVTVEAEGEGLTYQWYGRNAGSKSWFKSSVKDNTYDDVMTKARAGREVYCVITDQYGNCVTTDAAKLIRTIVELEILTQPTNSEAVLGESFCATVEAKGEGLKYQWYFRNAGSDKWYKSAVRDNTYDDVMTKARAGREVYCVVTDKYGNSVTTDIAKLIRVPAKLEITSQPTDATAAFGKLFCATVEAKGEGLKYQWYFRNAGSDKWYKSAVRDNTYDDVMTKARNGREIYCVITDKYGNCVTTDIVKLIAVPSVELKVQGQTYESAAMGERYCVTVNTQGEGLKYTWYFRNAGSDKWYKSTVRDNTYDDVMTKARAGREVYCVITDAFGNQVITEVITLEPSK